MIRVTGLVNQLRILVCWCGGAVVVLMIAYVMGKMREMKRDQAEAARMEGAASFDTKSLIFAILTGLLVGYMVGQAQIGEPWEKVHSLEAEKEFWQDTYLQYKDACFALKDQLENMTIKLYSLQGKLAETNTEYEALRRSYNKLEEEYEELESKHLDFVRVYNVKSFTLSNLTITPTVIELGQNVTISFYITNVHNESHRFGIATLIEGPDYGYEIWDSTTVGGYETKKISYIEFPEVVGNFTVTIGGLTGYFVVTQVDEG